jgi:hypothetical protein
MPPINLLAVVLAAAATFIIGFLAHGPVTGKLWMRLADVHPTGNEKLSDMYGQMFWNFVVNLISAYVLAVVYVFASTSPYSAGPGMLTGIVCGFLIWLGFIVTSSSINVIWMRASAKLWLFECVSSLIAFIAMGAIIAAIK